MKKLFLLFATVLLQATTTLVAQETADTTRMRFVLDSIRQSLKWQTGKIDLSNGMASIQVPEGFRYLNPEQSDFVLTSLWGNPPGQNSLGMLFPDQCGPLDDVCFAFNIRFNDIGYVKDDDAGDIDYDDLLKDMQKEAKEASVERAKEGYETIEIVRWASTPYYDKDKKVLHWAKEIKFGEAPNGNTLNYDVRALGRKGVLSLNAIGSMDQLENIKGKIPAIVNSLTFNDGHRYGDFNSNMDEVAAWTIGGLVAGKVLAKAGFFALILKFIKPILLLLVAGGGAIWRFITGRRKEETEDAASAASVAPPEPNEPGSDEIKPV